MLYFLNMHFALGFLKHVGSKELAAAVILLPAHPASFAHILSLGYKVFISVSPRMQ